MGKIIFFFIAHFLNIDLWGRGSDFECQGFFFANTGPRFGANISFRTTHVRTVVVSVGLNKNHRMEAPHTSHAVATCMLRAHYLQNT